MPNQISDKLDSVKYKQQLTSRRYLTKGKKARHSKTIFKSNLLTVVCKITTLVRNIYFNPFMTEASII